MEWYGKSYPSLGDLEALARAMGCPVAYHPNFDVPRFFLHSRTMQPWFIGVPEQFGNLARCWAVAHELGHRHLHPDGPVDLEFWRMQEDEADHWAACALIPEERVRHYKNASVGAFIAALHRNYQEIPKGPCGLRRLAARIALTRLGKVQASG